MDLMTSGFRSIIWIFLGLVLKVVDYIYSIILQFFSLNINQFPWIWTFFKIIFAALAFFVLMRIAIMFFKSAMGDTERIDKLSGGMLFQRLLAIVITLSFIPILMPALNTFVAESAKALPQIAVTSEVTPSDIIIEAGSANLKDNKLGETDTGIKLESGEHYIDKINVSNEGINEKDGGDYKYFKDTSNLVLSLILGGMCLYVFLQVAIQVIQRFVGILLKMVLAPYALSGLVDPDDQAASMWFKLCFSDYLGIYFQMATIWIAMLFATNLPNNFSGLAKGLAFIGALFSIIIAPSGVAQLIGADVGSQSGLQMMQQAQMLMGAVGTGLNIAKAGVGIAGVGALAGAGVGKTGLATAIYAGGRMMGARSLNPTGGGNASGGETPPSGNRTSELNANGGSSSSSEKASVNDRGILSYADGRVTNAGTRLNSLNTHSKMGSMASAFGNFCYTKSAQRIFNSKAQRQKMQANLSGGEKARNVIEGIKSGVNAVRAPQVAQARRDALIGNGRVNNG